MTFTINWTAIKAWFVAHWKGLVAALSFFFGTVCLAIFEIKAHPPLGKAGINAIEAYHAPKIQALNTKISTLNTTLASDQILARKAQQEVNFHKESLVRAYKSTGMSAQQIATRLAQISI